MSPSPSLRARRRISALLGVILTCALVVLSGCTRDTARGQEANARRPDRIVSQVVTSDEILWDLGSEVRARVIGVSIMADDPTYSSVAGQWPTEVPRVPGTSEALVAARPDLVIVASFTSKETQALLRASGIPTLLLENFEGFEDYRERVRAIARGVDAADAAQPLVDRFDARLEEVRLEVTTRPSVVSLIGEHVAGRGTTFDDVAKAAGFRNIAAEHGIEGHRAVALEQVVAWNPEFVVVDCSIEPCREREAEIAGAPGIAATTAGRNRQIVAIPPRHLYSTGLGMLETVRILAARHPEAR